jgi:hypothetical protein
MIIHIILNKNVYKIFHEYQFLFGFYSDFNYIKILDLYITIRMT